MSINEKSREWADGAQRNSLLPHYDFTERPQYELYQQGITEAHKGWIEILRKASGRYLVPVGAIWALYEIAREFLKSGSNRFDDKSFFGVLLVAGMILTIAIVSLRRIEDIDVRQEENREKDKDESAESGISGNSPGQNRGITARNRGPNLDGGGK